MGEFTVLSEVDVGDLHVTFYLQHVDFIEGLEAVEEVQQMLAVHKHLEPLVPTADRHLGGKERKQRGTFRAHRSLMRISSIKKRTHVEVLPVREGVHTELAFLLTPAASDLAVPHHDSVLHSGVHVEGDVSRSAHHEVEAHPATQRPMSV